MTRTFLNINNKDMDFFVENAKESQEFRETEITEKKYFDKGNSIIGLIGKDNPEIYVNAGYF